MPEAKADTLGGDARMTANAFDVPADGRLQQLWPFVCADDVSSCWKTAGNAGNAGNADNAGMALA